MLKVRPYRKRGQVYKGVYEVDLAIQYPDGTTYRERRKASVSTKDAAKRWGEARILHLLRTHGATPPTEKKVAKTFRQFSPDFLTWSRNRRQKPSTIESKLSALDNHILPLFGDLPMDALTPADVERLRERLIERTAKTANNILAVLSKTLNVARELGEIESVPCMVRGTKAPAPTMEFYEFDAYQALIDAARKIDRRTLLTVLLGGDAGLRAGEMIALEWTDIDFRRGILTVNRSEWQGEVTAPKGGQPRKVPLTALLAETLRAHKHLGTRILLRDDGAGVSMQTLTTWVGTAQRRANLRANGGKHILRHTFCSHLAMRGATAVTIKELAGHQSLSTTMRYMHLSPSHLSGAIALLDAGRGAGYGAMLEPGKNASVSV